MPTDPTQARAEACVAAGTKAGDLTGVELLALFEAKASQAREAATELISHPDTHDTGMAGTRASNLAITYGQEARQRYTEALAHLRGTHNPVDIEALDRDGVTAEQERLRFEEANREGGGS